MFYHLSEGLRWRLQCRNWYSITFLVSALVADGVRFPCPPVDEASRSANLFGVSFFLPGVTSPKSMVNANGSNLTVSVQLLLSSSSSSTCRVGVACWAAAKLETSGPVELSESLLKSNKEDEAADGRFSTAIQGPVSGIQWPGKGKKKQGTYVC